MKKGYKMTEQQKQSRHRQTLENQAQKMLNQQISKPSYINTNLEIKE